MTAAQETRTVSACDDCLRRTDLIAAIAGRLQIEFKQRSAPGRVLALPDEDLLELAPGEARVRYARFDPAAARERHRAARLWAVCHCRDDVSGPPARPRRPAGGHPRPRHA